MKKFVCSVFFCATLIAAFTIFLIETSSAKEDVIMQLLALPAPPPPNPFDVALPGKRPDAFYDHKNPPSDNAPIQDLLDYWKYFNERRGRGARSMPPISERAIERILAEVGSDPEELPSFIHVLEGSPRAAQLLKAIHDSNPNDPVLNMGLGNWLKYNSPYFTDELVRPAEIVADADDYVTNQQELLALSRHDWNRARPVLDRLYNDTAQPTSQVLARWAMYRHALENDDLGDIERYRDELKAIVENRQATHGQRDLALDALLKEREWGGRDDWYFSLFEDETLGDLTIGGRSYTGLTTLILESPEDKYVGKMVELVKSNNAAVRAAAARNLSLLLSPERPDAVRAMLPWLEDPKWAKDYQGSRARLVQILIQIKLPESVPGLLAALDESEKVLVPDYSAYANAANMAANAINAAFYAANAADTMSNHAYTTNSNSIPAATVERTVFPLRDSAVQALGMQADIRAAPALRRVFSQVETYQKNAVARAILRCGGFSTIEQLRALEGAVRRLVAVQKEQERVRSLQSTEDGDTEYDDRSDAATLSLYSTEMTLADFIGNELLTETEVSDDLVRATAARISALTPREPEVAQYMRTVLLRWKNSTVGLLLLEEARKGTADAPAVVTLLTARRELREKYPSAVSALRTGTPAAIGLAACMFESDADYAAILAAPDTEAKISMLACARLIRGQIAPSAVAVYVSAADKRLASAAEAYLESEDSPESRRIVLSLHPNEAKVLGGTDSGIGGSGERLFVGGPLKDLFASVDKRFANESPYLATAPDLEKAEERIAKEIRESTEVLGIYSYDSNFVRIFKDKAVFSWEEDAARYHERVLEKEEFENLTGFLAHHRVDELTPFLTCDGDCAAAELVMLGKQGGRRVFFRDRRGPQFAVDLGKSFDDMRQRPAKLRYWLEKDNPGLEILFSDENMKALAVWKGGDDLRVMISDEQRAEAVATELAEAVNDVDYSDPESTKAFTETAVALEKQKYQTLSWRSLFGGNLGAAATQPAEAEYLPAVIDEHSPPASSLWKGRTAGVEYRGTGEGLFKVTGGNATKIADGYFYGVVAAPGGRWLVASKHSDGNSGLVRVDLKTLRQFPVAAGDSEGLTAQVFVPSINRFLVARETYSEYDYHGGPHRPRSFQWLDPETGTLQKAPGELRPLAGQQWRALQPASAGNFQYWAAIFDEKKGETVFGLYDSRVFTFKPLLTLPKIKFDSQDMWVDEAAGKVIFVYQGDVLSVPFQNRVTPIK